ncbi:GlxA family transcriptional regulator [Undibacterium sp. TJN25]|uniref:GlxA family transcriptional regulator n=1 Tax=Undibacterium sp. TJN25 TaxID=3413056 RepID=UPI003BF3C1AF
MHRIGFVVFDGFQSMSFAALSVFESANMMLEQPFYEMHFISEHGGLVRSSTGMVVDSKPFGRIPFDTVIVGGGVSILESAPSGVLSFITKASKKSRRLASICTGTFVLGEAGVLDGKRATTHWAQARGFQARFPGVRMEEDRIFLIDGNIWTSAGMTAGIDLALAMAEKDLGEAIARSIAQQLVVYHRRAGGQSQHSALLELSPKSDRIQKTLAYAKENLHTTLSVEQLAEVANLSPRQFSRTFRVETGQSPAKAVENLRLEAAKLLMEQTRHSVDEIAQETGFLDRRRMREAFLRGFGQPPQTIRRNARVQA